MITTLIGVLFTALIVKIAFAYIRVYMALMQYKGKGTLVEFFFGPEYFSKFNQSLKQHKDMTYHIKNFHAEHPNIKVHVLNKFGTVLVRILDPELARDHFKNISTNYVRADDKESTFNQELGSGLLLSSGSVWKKHRKLTSSLFHFELLKQRTPDVLVLCDEIFGEMEKKGLKNVDLMNVFQSITGQMVGRLFFGAEFNKHQILGKNATDFVAEFASLLGAVQLNPVKLIFGLGIMKVGVTKLGRKYMQYKKAFDRFRIDFMETMKGNYEAKKKIGDTNYTMSDLFFKQREENPNECYDDKEIIDEFATFFIAGMDTTGHLLIMALYYLLQNPEMLQKVREEVNNTLGGEETYNTENLSKLDYMQIVFRETLRIATPAAANLPQTASHDHKIGESVTIKKGSEVLISYQSLNYSPLYHENPFTFNPNRWIDENSKTFQSVKEYPFLFTPFSSGPRNCIGQHLAIIEAKIILSRLLQKYTVEMADKNYDLKMKFGFLYEPQDPILINLELKV